MVFVCVLPAISQRDYTQYYQHILKQEEQICQAIQDFFSQHIQYNFLDEDCEQPPSFVLCRSALDMS